MGENPSVVAVRKEVLRQLGEVPESHRGTWEKRLRSRDHHHFSVRLELYLHDFFKGRGWEIEIEPRLSGTSNRPEFRLRRGAQEFLVEAKALLDPKPVEQQDTRLKELADRLSGRLNRTVSIHPLYDLPSSLPNRYIAAEIEKTASDVGFHQEFRIEGQHQGSTYALEVTVVLDEKPTSTAGVSATIGQAYHADTGRRMWEAMEVKAGKYGEHDVPFVITVWPQTHLYDPDDDDSIALYGDQVWQLPADHRGEIADPAQVLEGV